MIDHHSMDAHDYRMWSGAMSDHEIREDERDRAERLAEHAPDPDVAIAAQETGA